MSINNKFDSSSFSLVSGMGYKIEPLITKSDNKTNLEAQNVLLKFNDGDIRMNVNIPHLDADVYDKTPNDALNIADTSSFDLDIKNATVKLSDVDLSISIKNMLSKDASYLKDLKIDFIPGNKVAINFKLKKILNFNVKVEGDISTNPFNNTIKLTPQKISVNSIPVKGFLNLFNLKVGNIVKINRPSVYSAGDSMYIYPDKVVDNLTINGNFTGVKTGIGTISLMVGQDGVNPYKTKLEQNSENFLKIKGGNIEYNDFSLKKPDFTMLDESPNTPFDLIDDDSKKIIKEGQISIPDTFINKALTKDSGGDSALDDMNFSITNGKAKLTGTKWGFIPVKINIDVDKTQDGKAMITPNNSKAFGFIPLPKSYIKNAIADQVKGKVEGNGIVLDLESLANIQASPFKIIKTEDNKLTLEI